MFRQLGRAISIMAKHEASEIFMHDDVDAFHAPSECHDLVSRGENKRRRQARRHAKAVSGLNRRQFNAAFAAVSQKAFDRAVGAYLNRWYTY